MLPHTFRWWLVRKVGFSTSTAATGRTPIIICERSYDTRNTTATFDVIIKNTTRMFCSHTASGSDRPIVLLCCKQATLGTTTLSRVHHLTCGISSFSSFRQPHSVSLSSWFTSFCAYHLSTDTVTSFALTTCHSLDGDPRTFTPDLELISFTNPFLHSHSYSFRTAFTDSFNLYWIKGALTLFVLVSVYVCWIKLILSFRVHR